MKKLGSSGLGAFPQTAKVKLSDFLRNEEGKVGSRAGFGAASIAFAGAAAAMLAMPDTAEATRTCKWTCSDGHKDSGTVNSCGIPCRNMANADCASHSGLGMLDCT